VTTEDFQAIRAITFSGKLPASSCPLIGKTLQVGNHSYPTSTFRRSYLSNSASSCEWAKNSGKNNAAGKLELIRTLLRKSELTFGSLPRPPLPAWLIVLADSQSNRKRLPERTLPGRQKRLAVSHAEYHSTSSLLLATDLPCSPLRTHNSVNNFHQERWNEYEANSLARACFTSNSASLAKSPVALPEKIRPTSWDRPVVDIAISDMLHEGALYNSS
jgi:hypothetical protein